MAARKVLVCVDESEHSKQAFEWFVENVYRTDDEHVLCHIPETPQLPSFSFKHGMSLPVDEWKKICEQKLAKVKKLEEDYEAVMIQRKMKYQVKGEAHKNPGEGIIAVAESEKVNFIIMGTRGLDPVRRTLLGSVSDYVIRHSRVPVIICPKTQ